MIERRVKDFRLDARLMKYCGGDVQELCGGLEAPVSQGGSNLSAGQ